MIFAVRWTRWATKSIAIQSGTQVSSMPQFGLLALPVFIILSVLSGSTTPL